MDEALVVLGAGSRGIEEMRELLDDAAVQWALLRFELGSGAFTRKKFLFLHLNGEETPVVRRGQANAYTAEAQRLLRADDKEGFHASLAVTRTGEVTEEQLLARVGHFFVKDDLEYSAVGHAQQETLRQANRAPKASAAAEEARPGAKARPRLPGHASSQAFASGREALRAVAEPLGAWNWALLRPFPDPEALELAAGGTGSLDEMREELVARQGEPLFGLLRLGFGRGRLRRTKHVSVYAAGPGVPVVARGRMAASRPRMEQAVARLVHCSVALEVADAEDLTLEAVIERVRRTAVIDEDDLAGDAPPQAAYSVEAFRDALKEERLAAVPAEAAEASASHTQWSDRPVRDVVRLLHAPNGPLNWALFGPNAALMRARRSLPGHTPQPPSPVAASVAPAPAGGFAAAGARAHAGTL